MEPGRFKAKGVAFQGALQVAARVPGGLDAVLARMPPELAARVEPFYVAAGWYDVDVLVALMRACCAAMGVPFDEQLEKQAARAARADVAGLYRHAMRASSVADMSTRLPRIFDRYFSPTHASVRDAGETSVSVELSGVPERHEAFYVAMNQGFVAGALREAGAAEVRFSWPERRVLEPGVLSLTFRAEWS